MTAPTSAQTISHPDATVWSFKTGGGSKNSIDYAVLERPRWVKLGKAQSEQILSALPPIADIRIARSPTAEDLEAAIVKAALAQGWSERRAAGR
jgi:hypothetical protein